MRRAPSPLSLFGWVDEEKQETYALSIPAAPPSSADQSFETEYPGLNDFAEDEVPSL